MRSHVYQLTRREWFCVVVPLLAAVAGLAALSHLVAGLNMLPRPGKPATLDEAILHEKTNGCARAMGARLLFVGDSSCLMDVSAVELSRLVSVRPMWNLGTLSTLGLPRFRDFLHCYLLHNEEQPPAIVVLLMSPEMVRSSVLQSSIHQRPHSSQQGRKRSLLLLQQRQLAVRDPDRPLRAVYAALGLPDLRDRLAARLLNFPINERWGEFYGFFPDVERYMTAHDGCAVDPSIPVDPAAAAVFSAGELSDRFREQCAAFRAALPPSVKLAVGLTPVPQSAAPSTFASARNDVLFQIKDALQAEIALVNLPAAMDDHYFASATHLNPDGARLFTHYLSRSLQGKELGLRFAGAF